MAVLLPPSTPSSANAQYEPRQRSQPPPAERQTRARPSRQRSANHIKSKPANPHALQAILDSFDTLTPPPSTSARRANEYYSDTGSLDSKRSRRYSSDETLSTVPSIVRSTGFGMEYGRPPSPDDFGPSDAAVPPTVPTSRSPSGRSRYHAPSPSRVKSLGHSQRSTSILSRASSRSSRTKEKDTSARNKHSAESWIKQTQRTLDKEPVGYERSRSRQRSLSRVASQEALRSTISDVPDFPALIDPDTIAGAERVITKPAPSPAVRSRLYLSDEATVQEEKPEEDLAGSTFRDSGIDTTPQTRPAGKSPSNPTTPLRISPVKSPILDSIPTRTSSLRQLSSGPMSGKKRDRKLKNPGKILGVNTPKADSPTLQRSRSIPESSWADLGDDDETVKRIRQLREQRRSRIEESRALPSFSERQALEAESNAAVTRSIGGASEAKREARTRPYPSRALTEPPTKAHKVLGISEDAQMPALTGAIFSGTSRNTSISPEGFGRSRSRLEDRSSIIYQLDRPATATSHTPPLSLDYSYAQAVAVLQNADRDSAPAQQRNGEPSTGSATLKPHDLPTPVSRATSPGPAEARQRPKSVQRRAEPQDRWTAHHPDLPLDFDSKRSRRKSMSDARRTRHFDDKPGAQRRDSIEDAVVQYLYAPRLNQKVRHPLTGRVVSFSEVGDPEGAAVFVCVGMGLTRYVTAFYDELATTLRLRLITVDRPGVGASEPYPPGDRSGPLNWPDDILVICQRLGITKFSLLAHSAGAVYALAAALVLPHMIHGKVHLLAPWIPPSQLQAIKYQTTTNPPAGALPRSQRILRVLPIPFLKAANSSFMTATSASLKPASRRQLEAARAKQYREQSILPTRAPVQPNVATRPDHHRRESMMQMDQFMPTINPMENFPIPVKEEEEDEAAGNGRRGSLFLSATATPSDPNFTFASTALNAAEHAERERKIQYTMMLTQRTWELATRDSNPATDLLVCLERHREIGFRYTDVSRGVIITHGSEDKRVPLGNVRWLAEQMNARSLAGVLESLAEDSAPPTRDTEYLDETFARGGCDVRVLEGEGHSLMASAPIMSDVLTEIAGYWIGQDKGRKGMSV
ncbi:hypothetical protein B0A50_02931 [Salinomyces thailandicus]|uniref:AB hydrolase-1 domain-containing protein n=1 Tax=Salinomyces thailandicus TaxID=706561 RepID=A0A4U0U1M9_9PEZI|nr:hypothetical protein B0A50_02931 [Salinomyces thailandica]